MHRYSIWFIYLFKLKKKLKQLILNLFIFDAYLLQLINLIYFKYPVNFSEDWWGVELS